MAADDFPEREDRTVRFLESLCESVQSECSDQVRCLPEVRPIKEQEQQDG